MLIVSIAVTLIKRFSVLERVLSAYSPEQKALWQRCISGSAKKKQAVAVLVSVPRPAGGRSVVGLAFTVHMGKVLANGIFDALHSSANARAVRDASSHALVDHLRKLDHDQTPS